MPIKILYKHFQFCCKMLEFDDSEYLLDLAQQTLD